MESSVEERSAGKSVSRRNFLKTAWVSALALVSGSWLGGCGSKNSPAGLVSTSSAGSGITLDVTLPENKALADAGGMLALGSNALDPNGIFVFRSSETSAEALSRKCTHRGCQVAAFANEVAKCPCHGSQFDTNGQVINGPANKPLARYRASVDGTIITITPAS